MAERRMFTKKITDDERFYMLPASTQLLYFHLSMAADDDGFCNQISVSMFKSHASVADLETLLDKRYLYQFENGVIVIKHWRMANALRKDRYTPTVFQEELSKLGIKDNGSYTWLPNGCQMVADCLPQDRLGKERLDKDSIEEKRKDNKEITPKGVTKKVVYFPNDESLNEAFESFVEMRKKIKKPMTDKAIELAINKLEKLSNNDNDVAIEIINQSVLNGWQSFYEIKDSSKTDNKKGIDWANV